MPHSTHGNYLQEVYEVLISANPVQARIDLANRLKLPDFDKVFSEERGKLLMILEELVHRVPNSALETLVEEKRVELRRGIHNMRTLSGAGPDGLVNSYEKLTHELNTKLGSEFVYGQGFCKGDGKLALIGTLDTWTQDGENTPYYYVVIAKTPLHSIYDLKDFRWTILDESQNALASGIVGSRGFLKRFPVDQSLIGKKVSFSFDPPLPVSR